MSLKALLAAGRLKRHKTGPNELKKLFAVVDRDLKDARVAGLSADLVKQAETFSRIVRDLFIPSKNY